MMKNRERSWKRKRFCCDFAQLSLNIYRICCLNKHSASAWDPTVEFTQSMYFCASKIPSSQPQSVYSPTALKCMSHKWLAKADPLIKQHVV